jgi:Flp pilus assembly protein TadG
VRDAGEFSIQIYVLPAIQFSQFAAGDFVRSSPEQDGKLMFSSPYRLRLRAVVLSDSEGSALVEFAIVLPILLVFVVGIYDFSDALSQRQKIQQAVQEGAIVAGSQSTSDLQSASGSNPTSTQSVVAAILNSLTGSGVLTSGACSAPGTPALSGLTWNYTISCNNSVDNLVISINRGWVCGSSPPPPLCPSLSSPSCTGSPVAVGSSVAVTYPYHWKLFGSVIQLITPSSNSYSTPATLAECASVHNQM